jgi:hypothetical protein
LLVESETEADTVEKTVDKQDEQVEEQDEQPQVKTEETKMSENTTAFENNEVAATAEAEVTTATEETRIATAELVDNVLLQLAGLCADVQRRNEELPNEVVNLFNLDDLEGIQSLMLQRKRISALAEDMQALIAKWSDEIEVK